MSRNIFLCSLWGLIFLILLAGWSPLWASKVLPLQEEAALFSLADLGPVDLSIKRTTLEVYASPHPEIDPFHRLMPLVWPQVQNFFARMGVIMKMSQGRATPGSLMPGKNLRLEALTHKAWIGRSFKAFQVAPPFRLRFLAVCQDKYAFAHLHLAIIHLDFRRFQE